MSKRNRRLIFWLGVIVLLVSLFKVLTFLVHLSISLVILVIAAILLWSLYQAAKSKWL